MNPYRRFTLLLASSLCAGVVLVTAVAGWLLRLYFAAETARMTADAVTQHFRGVFGADVFRGAAAVPPGASTGDAAPPAGSGSSAAQASGTGAAPPQVGAHPGHGGAALPPALQRLDRAVRFHFDLYRIQHTAFYRPDGTVVYSYRPADIGRVALPPGGREALARAHPVFQVERQGLTGATLHQFIPILEGEAVVGVVEVVRDLDPQVRAFAILLAAVSVTVVLVFAGLFLALRHLFRASTEQISRQSRALAGAVQELQATYDATLRAISAALDLRDTETEGHAVRVAAYAARIARQMGLQGEVLADVVRGALLHDVGKIGVPDHILRKPGPLTPEEWVEMRKHPEIGYRMLKDIPFLRSALPVVLYHHERYDGTGYPCGLKGEEIPLAARIFAVADALDAMTSDRPYRKARSFAEARVEIRRMSGSQFDPQVVRAFLSIPDEEWQELARQAAALREGQASLWGHGEHQWPQVLPAGPASLPLLAVSHRGQERRRQVGSPLGKDRVDGRPKTW